jgi:hypothetical protein
MPLSPQTRLHLAWLSTRDRLLIAHRAVAAGRDLVTRTPVTHPGSCGVSIVAEQATCEPQMVSTHRGFMESAGHTCEASLGALIACLDATLRRIGGAPTYLLGDNARRSRRSTWPRWRCVTRRCGRGPAPRLHGASDPHPDATQEG